MVRCPNFQHSSEGLSQNMERRKKYVFSSSYFTLLNLYIYMQNIATLGYPLFSDRARQVLYSSLDLEVLKLQKSYLYQATSIKCPGEWICCQNRQGAAPPISIQPTDFLASGQSMQKLDLLWFFSNKFQAATVSVRIFISCTITIMWLGTSNNCSSNCLPIS